MSVQELICDYVKPTSSKLAGHVKLCNLSDCLDDTAVQKTRRVQCHCDSVAYNADHLPFGEGINWNRYFKILQTQKSVAE